MESLKTFNHFLASLEDGALHKRLTDQLGEVHASLVDHEVNYGGKAKAKLSLTIEFTSQDGITEIVAESKLVPPKLKKGRSVLWTTRDGTFSRANPKQLGFFTDVNAPGEGGTVRAV
jgi:hypothetical protein